MEILSKELKAIALEINQFVKIDIMTTLIEPFYVELINIPIKGTQSETVSSKKHAKRCHRQFGP